MESDWPTYALTDLYSVSSGLSKPAKDFGEGHPFVSFKDVFYNFFLPDNLSQLVRSTEKEQEKCSVRRGDVFLTRTSETMEDLGMSCVARKDYPGATFNGFSKRLRPSTDLPVHPEYVGYYLRTPQFRNEMLAFSTMSTRASLNNEMIGRLQITLPPLPEQKAIAHILGTLDDKIELNRRMNATLEGMAQALFKSWFVDFDPVIDNALAAGNPIPDELAPRAEVRKKALGERSSSCAKSPMDGAEAPPGSDIAPAMSNTSQMDGAGAPSLPEFPSAFQFTEELGWIPEGWEVKPLSDAIQINPSIKLSKGAAAQFADMKALPTSGYAIDGVIEKEYSGGAKFQNDDVLFARITPCLENGKTGIVDFLSTPEDVGFGSTEFIVLRGKGDLTLPFVACLARNETFRLHCKQSMVGSSGRQRVQNACFDSFHAAIPTEPSALKSFDSITTPMFWKSSEHGKASGTLTKLRDTLLPKLISGELRLPEAEQLTEEAMT